MLTMARNSILLCADRLATEKVDIPTTLPHNNNLGTIMGDRAMKHIKLTKGKTAIVDNDDYDRLMALKCKWQAHKGYSTYYAVRDKKINGKREWITLARDVLQCPKGTIIDHKNHNGLDTRKKNLRICTFKQNQTNTRPHKNASSKYKGVRVHKYGYIHAQIGYDRKVIHLGTFATEKEAALAYDVKAVELFGEFAYLNFPDLKDKDDG